MVDVRNDCASMSDVMTKKDVDDLRKSLSDLNNVIDDFTRKIGSSLGDGEVESSHHRWRMLESQ